MINPPEDFNKPGKLGHPFQRLVFLNLDNFKKKEGALPKQFFGE